MSESEFPSESQVCGPADNGSGSQVCGPADNVTELQVRGPSNIVNGPQVRGPAGNVTVPQVCGPAGKGAGQRVRQLAGLGAGSRPSDEGINRARHTFATFFKNYYRATVKRVQIAFLDANSGGPALRFEEAAVL